MSCLTDRARTHDSNEPRLYNFVSSPNIFRKLYYMHRALLLLNTVSLQLSQLLAVSDCVLSRVPSVCFPVREVYNMAMVNNCRLHDYQDGVKRFPVPEDKVSWSVDWPEYKPVDHTSPHVLKGPIWADLDFRLVYK